MSAPTLLRLRALLSAALLQLEEYEEVIDGEWGASRELKDIPDADLSPVIPVLRKALGVERLYTSSGPGEPTRWFDPCRPQLAAFLAEYEAAR